MSSEADEPKEGMVFNCFHRKRPCLRLQHRVCEPGGEFLLAFVFDSSKGRENCLGKAVQSLADFSGYEITEVLAPGDVGLSHTWNVDK